MMVMTMMTTMMILLVNNGDPFNPNFLSPTGWPPDLDLRWRLKNLHIYTDSYRAAVYISMLPRLSIPAPSAPPECYPPPPGKE